MKKILCTLLFSLNAFCSTNLDLNDVSVLLPLPNADQVNLLLSGNTKGLGGDLLPLRYVTQLPNLTKIATNAQMYPFIKVLGIRIDPCFTEGSSVVACRRQIRLVWQPLMVNASSVSTFDTALHSFYDLSEAQFDLLIKNIQSIKPTGQTFLPLQKNPLITGQGFTGAYYSNYIKILLQFIGEDTLSRVTFMQLGQNGNVWTFGGFDIVNKNLVAIQIPKINSTTEEFRNSAKPDPIFFSGGASPAPTDSDNINLLIQDSSTVDKIDESTILNEVRVSQKIENPRLNNPGTVDCVSCHVAQAAKNWSINHFTKLNFLILNDDIEYKSTYDLTNLSLLQNKTNIMRAFGYYNDTPVVSQRTINESADVLNTLNQKY